MVRLAATRLDLRDTFQFSIEADGRTPSVTRDPVKAAKLLSRMGVTSPMRMVDHVQVWGSVEIVADGE